jgi:hypothetical protein
MSVSVTPIKLIAEKIKDFELLIKLISGKMRIFGPLVELISGKISIFAKVNKYLRHLG